MARRTAKAARQHETHPEKTLDEYCAYLERRERAGRRKPTKGLTKEVRAAVEEWRAGMLKWLETHSVEELGPKLGDSQGINWKRPHTNAVMASG